jgi:hypothetical protein
MSIRPAHETLPRIPPRPSAGALGLTDVQVQAIIDAARPLQPDERSAFLEALTKRVAGRTTIGDGELCRLLRELQRTYFKPPLTVDPEINFGVYAPRPRPRRLRGRPPGS